jgi:hypothetical protein
VTPCLLHFSRFASSQSKPSMTEPIAGCQTFAYIYNVNPANQSAGACTLGTTRPATVC